MPNPKILELLERLRSATIEGRLIWTEALPGMYALSLKAATVMISKDSEFGYTSLDFSLVRAKELLSERETFQEGGLGFELALSLYEQASRGIPKKVNHLIDDVLADLDVLTKK